MNIQEALVISKLQEKSKSIAGYFIGMQILILVLGASAAYLIAPWQGLSPSSVLPYVVVGGSIANLIGFVLGTALGLKIAGSNP